MLDLANFLLIFSGLYFLRALLELDVEPARDQRVHLLIPGVVFLIGLALLGYEYLFTGPGLEKQQYDERIAQCIAERLEEGTGQSVTTEQITLLGESATCPARGLCTRNFTVDARDGAVFTVTYARFSSERCTILSGSIGGNE